MKLVAVFPDKPNCIHLAELPMPRVSDIPGGRGVLVKVLRVGVFQPMSGRRRSGFPGTRLPQADVLAARNREFLNPVRAESG